MILGFFNIEQNYMFSQVGMEVLSKVCLFGIKLQSFFNIRKITKCFSVSFTIGEVDDH